MGTLADMSEEARAEHRGMWCEDASGALCVYMGDYRGLAVGAYPVRALVMSSFIDELTPRPDLPRAWTADGQPPAGEWEHARIPALGAHTRRFVGEWKETQDQLTNDE